MADREDQDKVAEFDEIEAAEDNVSDFLGDRIFCSVMTHVGRGPEVWCEARVLYRLWTLLTLQMLDMSGDESEGKYLAEDVLLFERVKHGQAVPS